MLGGYCGATVFHASCAHQHVIVKSTKPRRAVFLGVSLTGMLMVNALFFELFPTRAPPREAKRAASSTWYVCGVILAYALFPTRIAVPAIVVLALADPMASIVGRLWGSRRGRTFQ